MAYPDLLLMKLSSDSPLIKPLQAMKQSALRAANMVQDMLSLARRGVINKISLNPNNIINEYLNSLEFKKIMELYPQINIEINLEENIKNIKGSSIHLQKVLMNLIINALEAIKKEGKVTISTKNISLDSALDAYELIKPGDYVCISVSDTGEGIPEEYLPKIFEPFFTRKVMGRSGTGLGLSVVWGIVKEHDGFIDVKSKPFEGTSFHVFIPITSDHPDNSEFFKEKVSLEEMAGRGESILVIDDEKEQRQLATQILTSLKYNVYTASSAQEALNFLSDKKVDIILLDMIIEEQIDGLDIYKNIKKINPNQKVIIVSGFSQTQRVNEALMLGAKAFIQKPYNPINLAITIRNILTQKM